MAAKTNVMTKAGRGVGQGRGAVPLCTPGAAGEATVPHPASAAAGSVRAASEQRHAEVKIILRDLKLTACFPESLRKHGLFGGGFC